MMVSKKYIHDRLVLFLVSVDTFFAALLSLWVLLRLNADKATTYIVSYNAADKVNPTRKGNSFGILAFIIFVLFQLGFNVFLSIKAYHIRRYFSIAILAMTLLLIIIALIVSNSLLILR